MFDLERFFIEEVSFFCNFYLTELLDKSDRVAVFKLSDLFYYFYLNKNQRLPRGYHLSVDVADGPVNLHFDAYDPINGPLQTFNHWYNEVRLINNGQIKVPDHVDNNPDSK